MEQRVEVEIGGHKAWIKGVYGRRRHYPWWPEDTLDVMIDLDEAVEGILSLDAHLPVKDYTREEFYEVVKRESEARLNQLLEETRAMRKQRTLEKDTQANLDRIARGIKTLIGLGDW